MPSRVQTSVESVEAASFEPETHVDALTRALESETVRDLVFSYLRIQGEPMRQAALGAVRAAEAASRGHH
jgi:hypothetical protein